MQTVFYIDGWPEKSASRSGFQTAGDVRPLPFVPLVCFSCNLNYFYK